MKTYFVTGGAGFIGSSLVSELLKKGNKVVVIDNFCDFYNPEIKEKNISEFNDNERFKLYRGDIRDKELLNKIFEENSFDAVIHLAAMAGVRPSIENPILYQDVNCMGTQNILEVMKKHNLKKLVMASSSSVYGNTKEVPFREDMIVDFAISPYAATKKANEVMTHVYHKLEDYNVIMLRFFTVYGPAGRPDMAYFDFTNRLLKGESIKIFNYGNCKRDFTYIDDIVEGVMRIMAKAPKRQNGEDGLPIPPYKIYNIGNNRPENLLDFVQILQEELVFSGILPADYDFEAHKELMPMQPGDVSVTYADITPLRLDFDFKPSTSLRDGLRAFAVWYKEFYLE